MFPAEPDPRVLVKEQFRARVEPGPILNSWSHQMVTILFYYVLAGGSGLALTVKQMVFAQLGIHR